MVFFLTYFFDEKSGVGAQRSKSLYEFLTKRMDSDVRVFSKDDSMIKSPLLWGVLAFFYALRSNHKIIYISCGPYLNLLPLILLKFFSNKKIVIDFRDPWSFNIKSGYGKGRTNIFRYIISVLFERISYKYCDIFVVCTIGMKDYYSQVFKDSKKIRYIANGHQVPIHLYKEREKRGLLEKENLKVICIGKLMSYNNESLIEKLKLKIENIQKGNNNAIFTFIGSEGKDYFDQYFSKEVMKNFCFIDKLPYKEAIKHASVSDIGILTLRDENMEYGTKIFDYIGLGLPVLDIFDNKKIFFEKFKFSFLNVEEIISINDSINYSREVTNKKIYNVISSLIAEEENE
ncbi:hypothetical protein [Cytobacillus firmus]|uniref:hypothetical protein n=1 Tax=Cytobacillus firmus TaxID=1399 RepID=UPI00064F0E30|nr:hypothetical protein [Cytobacillus firmus]KML41338.1 hypothetical protein VL14_11485 [Cytobacillus firmus]